MSNVYKSLLQHSRLLLAGIPLIVTGCMTGNNQGLQSMPGEGIYAGSATSAKYQQGAAYGIISNQSQFGSVVTVVQLVMNFNNRFMGMISGNLVTTYDTGNCMTGNDLVSESATGVSVTSASIVLSNCSWNNGQFSASYAVYKKSGAEMDRGSFQIAVNQNCAYYPVTVESLPNGNYSGGIQSCLGMESGVLGGHITDASAMLFTNFGESNMIESDLFESSIIIGTANIDYATMLTESITSGTKSGFITPFLVININVANDNINANYLSYYDYGTFQTVVGE